MNILISVNTYHGALTTKISTYDFPEVFLRISIVKNVAICDSVWRGSLEAENTKYRSFSLLSLFLKNKIK
jgi:hypothetical protein